MADNQTNAIDVKPVVLEDGTELRSLSDADKWIAEVADTAKRIAQQYSPSEITTDEEYTKAKSDRAAARTAIKQIQDERKSKTGLIKKVLREFDESTRKALEPLSDIDDEYKKYIGEYDLVRQAKRLDEIKAYYETTYPQIASLVPFTTLDATFGAKDKWHNVTTSNKRVHESVDAHADEISKSLLTIAALDYDPDQIEETKLEYVKTLDLGAALDAAHDRAERRKRIAESEAAAKTPEPAPEPVQAAPASTPEPVPAATTPEPTPAPASAPAVNAAPVAQAGDFSYQPTSDLVNAPMGNPCGIPDYDSEPEPAPAPAPQQPVPMPQQPAQVMPTGEQPRRYQIVTDYITLAQLAALNDALAVARIPALLYPLD